MLVVINKEGTCRHIREDNFDYMLSQEAAELLDDLNVYVVIDSSDDDVVITTAYGYGIGEPSTVYISNRGGEVTSDELVLRVCGLYERMYGDE